MEYKKHKPPSRIRYEENNPVLSIRMPKEWLKELDDFLKEQGMSRGDFFRISFEKQKANYHGAYMQGDKDGCRIGYNAGNENGKTEGYTKGMNDLAIWAYCGECNEAAYITPNSDIHTAIIEFLKERGFAHTKCHEE